MFLLTIIGVVFLLGLFVFIFLKKDKVDLKKIHNGGLTSLSKIDEVENQENNGELSPRQALNQKREILNYHNK